MQSSTIQSADAAIPDDAFEFIFLGTGTSSSVPEIGCLTAFEEGERTCKACTSTLNPEGHKNIRRNTSAVFRVKGRDGKKATVLIDVGKNFQAAALEWFPKYGLRKIDAVLITHAHADAMNGLDDLRGWTLGGQIQSHIDIYLSSTTMDEVQRAFPYMVSKEFASGGGDVPEFKWHIISDRVPFEIEDTGIKITPFAVHHGRFFGKSPPPGNLPTPASETMSGRNSPALPLIPDTIVFNKPLSIQPYLCLGFKIEDALIYMSDVSYIPEDVWASLIPSRTGGGAPLPVFVVDCLNMHPHTSHFGLRETVAAMRRMGATRSYITGMSHDVSHDEYEEILAALEGRMLTAPPSSSDIVLQGRKIIGEGKSLWARPAFDGLRLVVSPDGTVSEKTKPYRRVLF
ncbi:hypothetical protein SCHPADRAFT_946650 [Schizopora paradoxa]|uniref:Metallo-beta-lactamase domain-containing protein n=1 Tax=Schizopora paradoxa TaxID=27342 RepID=A0A0H2RLP3_9AGAM|nr:hypothetical protein SCHPADRAFT_946650 [Schizopora paradoxa]